MIPDNLRSHISHRFPLTDPELRRAIYAFYLHDNCRVQFLNPGDRNGYGQEPAWQTATLRSRGGDLGWSVNNQYRVHPDDDNRVPLVVTFPWEGVAVPPISPASTPVVSRPLCLLKYMRTGQVGVIHSPREWKDVVIMAIEAEKGKRFIFLSGPEYTGIDNRRRLMTRGMMTYLRVGDTGFIIQLLDVDLEVQT